MNILHVTFNMGIGGTEQVICQLIAGLDANRFDNQVVCVDGEVGSMGLSLQDNGVNIYPMNRSNGLDIQVIKRINQLVKSQNIDVLHCHQYTPYCYGVLAAFFTPAKVIFTEHGRFYPDSYTWKRRIVNKLLLLGTHAVTAISSATRESLATYEWIPERVTSVIYNGIMDPGTVTGDVEQLRHQLGLADDAIVVGTISRLDPIKNQLMMIEGFSIAAKINPNVRLLIVGDGPSKDELTRRVTDLAIGDLVIFTGFIDQPYPYLELFDVFLLTSRSEGTSMTLLEAMAKQKACIVTNVGGNPEVVINNKTGLIVESENTQEFSDALKLLISDKDSRQAMGVAGRQRYLEYFTISKMVDQYEKLYVSTT